MQKLSKLFAFSALTLGLVIACSDSPPPIEIKAYDKVDPIFSAKYGEIEVISKVDQVVIQDAIGNRNNCKLGPYSKSSLPKSLKFGQSVKLTFTAPCTLSQVDVITDQGEWTESYQ